MKSNQLTKMNDPVPSNHEEVNFFLPPGMQLNDVFIDGAQVVQELFISKRTLHNWRANGILSFTKRFGKIYYFKQEIARILFEGKECRKTR